MMYQLSTNGAHPFFERNYHKQELYYAILNKELKIPEILSQYQIKLFIIKNYVD